MNVERLHTVLAAIRDELTETGIVDAVSELRDALSNVNSAPNESHQIALGEALGDVYRRLNGAPSDAFSPAWRQTVADVGGAHLLGAGLRSRIQRALAGNQVTTALALEDVEGINQELGEFAEAVSTLLESLSHLGIGRDDLQPGQCELGLLIPRAAVEHDLDSLRAELRDLSFVLNTFSELIARDKERFRLRTLSSSDFTVFLDTDLAAVVAALAYGLDRIISTYKKILEIRRLRAELKSHGLADDKLSGVTEYSSDLMRDEIKQIVEEQIKKYGDGHERGRRNELENRLTISYSKLATKIDRGFSVEVRVEPLPPAEVEDDQEEPAADVEARDAITQVQQVAGRLEYARLVGDPVLKLPEASEESD